MFMSPLLGMGISAILILITLTSVEFNFQTFASQNISKSTITLNANHNASQFNASTSNSSNTYNRGIISILSLNQNQRQVQVDPIILDRLVSNATSGNIFGIPIDTFCTTLHGTRSDTLGINEQNPCTVTLSDNNKEIHFDFDSQVIENDDTDSIEEYYNSLQQPNYLNLQPDEIFVFSREGGEEYDDLAIYLVQQNVGNGETVSMD